MKILVTGGAGYIGSHTCVELLEAGFEIIIVDNLVNSSKEAIKRIEKITNKKVIFYQLDLCDKMFLENVFKENKIDGVIHFAGLKAVGESVELPLKYYQNNLISTLNLLEIMEKYHVYNFVFSSSATVYGNPESVPISEDFKTEAINPYGRTKLMIEEILCDIQKANDNFNIIILRYFNPIGAHSSGLLGEDPKGIPNNLLPIITKVALNKIPILSIYGNDYNTVDGTGVRDYIHVVDLAKGHISALLKLQEKVGLEIFNLGTGKGVSVLEMIKTFEKVSGRKIPYKFVERRAGDVAECYADCKKANIKLNWQAEKTVEEACRDSWNFQKLNPNGYISEGE